MPDLVRCPSCKAKTRWEGNPHRPFCSERCKLEDLGSWAAERYRIPGSEPLEPNEPDDPASEDDS
ncbi:MAG: DNA gyrase inhibitor YacG [Candidatus Binatia bacterium]